MMRADNILQFLRLYNMINANIMINSKSNLGGKNFAQAEIIEPCHEKMCLRGLRPDTTQTSLLRYRD